MKTGVEIIKLVKYLYGTFNEVFVGNQPSVCGVCIRRFGKSLRKVECRLRSHNTDTSTRLHCLLIMNVGGE
jgi:hypothetical protein